MDCEGWRCKTLRRVKAGDPKHLLFLPCKEPFWVCEDGAFTYDPLCKYLGGFSTGPGSRGVSICSLTFEDRVLEPVSVCSRSYGRLAQTALPAPAAPRTLQCYSRCYWKLPSGASQLPAQPHWRIFHDGIWQPFDNIIINSHRFGGRSHSNLSGILISWILDLGACGVSGVNLEVRRKGAEPSVTKRDWAQIWGLHKIWDSEKWMNERRIEYLRA